jgi:gas vesicle protein
MQRKHLYAGITIGALIVFLTSSLIVEKRLADLRSSIDTEVKTDLNSLAAMAPMMANGEQNKVINSLIRNCPATENADYDKLLGSLDRGLSAAELKRLEMLFKLCGHIPADRRAGMVYLMEQKLSNLNLLAERREQLGDYSKEDLKLEGWGNLASKEKEISELFLGLVDSQGKIIDSLIDNVSSEELANVQIEAQNIKAKLITAAEEASTLRSTLVSS